MLVFLVIFTRKLVCREKPVVEKIFVSRMLVFLHIAIFFSSQTWTCSVLQCWLIIMAAFRI